MRAAEDVGFSDFVAARWDALYRTAYLLTGNRADAEDLVQSALANTLAGRHRIRAAEATEAYVRRAMVNQASRGWKRRDRERVTEFVPDAGHDGGVEQQTARLALWEAIRALPPRMRTALVLRYYEDLSEAQTAAEMGCSVGAVKSQTHHALRKLRATLGEPVVASLPGGTR